MHEQVYVMLCANHNLTPVKYFISVFHINYSFLDAEKIIDLSFCSLNAFDKNYIFHGKLSVEYNLYLGLLYNYSFILCNIMVGRME